MKIQGIGALALAGALTSTVAAAEPFAWGVNGHPLTQVGYRDVPIATQCDLLAELGAGWYRVDVSAGAYEMNQARFDDLLAEATRRRMRLLPVLLSAPGGRSKDATPAQVHAAAVTFGKAMATRYRSRITHWELSNELDIPAMIRKGETTRSGKLWEWSAPAGDTADQYEESRYQLARAEITGLAEGIKAGDPLAKTMVDAGWLHYGFIERLVKEDKVAFDILAWHWYSEMGDITKAGGKVDVVKRLKSYGKPLWITEINRRDGSKDGKQTEQAEYLMKTLTQLRANPAIEAVFVYELLDEPYFGATNPESHYGLAEMKQDSQKKWKLAEKKQAFEAYKKVLAGNRTGIR